MNQQEAKAGGAARAKAKSRWMRPEYCSFDAGAAEQGDVTNPDGNVNS